MGGFFSYESKPMQIMMFLGDIILLNVIYILCCLPVFTIGAAQAGMFTACKVLLDKEDDSSPYAAFWRGFTSGFGTVTLAWGVATVVMGVTIWFAVSAMLLEGAKWLSWIAMGLVAVFQCLVPAFHSRFGCKWWQLLTNSWFLLFAHPLRSIGTTLLIWIPGIAFALLDLHTFMTLTPIWGALYYATAFCFASTFLKKPFKTLTDHYNEVHGIKPEGEEKPAEDEEYDEAYDDEYDDEAEYLPTGEENEEEAEETAEAAEETAETAEETAEAAETAEETAEAAEVAETAEETAETAETAEAAEETAEAAEVPEETAPTP